MTNEPIAAPDVRNVVVAFVCNRQDYVDDLMNNLDRALTELHMEIYGNCHHFEPTGEPSHSVPANYYTPGIPLRFDPTFQLALPVGYLAIPAVIHEQHATPRPTAGKVMLVQLSKYDHLKNNGMKFYQPVCGLGWISDDGDFLGLVPDYPWPQDNNREADLGRFSLLLQVAENRERRIGAMLDSLHNNGVFGSPRDYAISVHSGRINNLPASVSKLRDISLVACFMQKLPI